MAIATDSSVPRCSIEEWADFRHLVRHGMLFEVMEWIDSGKPTLRPQNKHASPLEDAVTAPNLSMTQVLWERAWQEPAETDRAMHAITWQKGSKVVLRYLLENDCPTGWLCGYDLCLTHDLDLVRLGMARGVNILEPDGWASAFREVGSRPLIRFYLEEKDRIPGLKRDAVVAMCRCITESRLRAVALLRWAGIDPLGKGPKYVGWEGAEDGEWDAFPALHIADAEKADELLKLLKLKPSPQQWFDMIDSCANSNKETFNTVVKLEPNPEQTIKDHEAQAGRLLVDLLKSVCWRIYSSSNQNSHIIELCSQMVDVGVQPQWKDSDEINRFRRDFYKCRMQDDILNVLARTAHHANESNTASLKLLINKPKMRALTRQKQPELMRFLSLATEESLSSRKRSTKKCVRNTRKAESDYCLPKGARTPPKPRHQQHYGAIIIKRDELYEMIWDKPATHVAEKYGISGSMLARICTGLNVPRPPRGYWPRSSRAKRRLKKHLPKLKEGEVDFWAVNPANINGQHRKAN